MLTIGKLAKESNVNVGTLRYYESRALLAPISRSRSGYRIYDHDSIGRVHFIKKAQSLGFTLDEIAQLLYFDGSSQATASDVLTITKQKIDQQTEKIKELKSIEGVLNKLVKECSGKGSAHDCPILKYLYPETSSKKN